MTNPVPSPTASVPFVLVGWGYRSHAWLAAARGIDGVPCAGVVVRTRRETPVPAFESLAEALDATGARFVVSSVSWDSAPVIVASAVTRGVPILTETPPAPDAEGLRRLWGEVGASGLVQAAEQYTRYPSHAARLALVRSGVLGTPTQTQVSSTQLYHAVALMRAYLGAPCGPATVRATTVTAPLLQPLARMGWTGATDPVSATTTHAVVDFGTGRSGVYDFTDLQTRNLLRVRRLVVRGTHGELDGDSLVRWGGPETILTSRLERRQSGHDLDMSGFDSETISHGDTVLWRNPWPGRHWSDDEHATAAMLRDMAAWVDGRGPEPYPLRDSLEDAAVSYAMEQSAAEDRPVELTDQPWWIQA
ncbi:MAG: gfo/Idh/MocA family oxidoreductase [Actinomycetes bacterium]